MSGPAAAADHLWVIGAGRMGLSLASLLQRSGGFVSVTVIGRASEAPPHPLFSGSEPRAKYRVGFELAGPTPAAILLAVPDDAIAKVVRELAGSGYCAGAAVLHLSGATERELLAPLAAQGCSTGVLHPLRAVADAMGGAEALRGAWYGVEAEGAALALASRIVTAAGGRMLRLDGGSRALYHAAAVAASNHVVVLLALAERMMTDAGVAAEDARGALADLARGSVADVERCGPRDALTGPVARGDLATVRAHLDALPAEPRAVYMALSRVALRIARDGGLGGARADRMQQLLEERG